MLLSKGKTKYWHFMNNIDYSHRYGAEFEKHKIEMVQMPKSSYCVTAFIWSSELGVTSLWWIEVGWWLPLRWIIPGRGHKEPVGVGLKMFLILTRWGIHVCACGQLWWATNKTYAFDGVYSSIGKERQEIGGKEVNEIKLGGDWEGVRTRILR